MGYANQMATFNKKNGSFWRDKDVVNVRLFTTKDLVAQMPHSPHPWWRKWNRHEWSMVQKYKQVSVSAWQKIWSHSICALIEWFHRDLHSKMLLKVEKWLSYIQIGIKLKWSTDLHGFLQQDFHNHQCTQTVHRHFEWWWPKQKWWALPTNPWKCFVCIR